MLLTVTENGRSQSRAISNNFTFKFDSRILPYYRTEDDVLLDAEDLVIEYKGKSYYIGKVCEFVEDGETGQQLKTEKATPENLLFSLTSLMKLRVRETNLVTNVPFSHLKNDEEKRAIKEMFSDKHEVRLYYGDGNGIVREEKQVVRINKVGIMGEGASAFFLDPTLDDVGIVDLGSRTLNAVYFRKGRIHFARSFTREWGWDTLKQENRTPEKAVERIIPLLEKHNWGENISIRLIGGVANKLHPVMTRYYLKSTIVPNPRNANLLGMYAFGKSKLG